MTANTTLEDSKAECEQFVSMCNLAMARAERAEARLAELTRACQQSLELSGYCDNYGAHEAERVLVLALKRVSE